MIVTCCECQTEILIEEIYKDLGIEDWICSTCLAVNYKPVSVSSLRERWEGTYYLGGSL